MNYTEAVRLIESAREILFTTHVRCDGDAVGSIAALERVIGQQASKDSRQCSTQVLLLGGLPDTYRCLLVNEPWLWPVELIGQHIQAGRLDSFDLIVVADTCAAAQLSGIFDYIQRPDRQVLVIDHHLADCEIGSCRLVDHTASATGEIVFRLFRQAGWSIDAEVASALFAAIATDTGWFRFENSSAQAYSVASELIAAGARPHELYRQIYERFGVERVRLLAEALTTLQLHCQGRCATMQITTEMLERTHAKRSHIENMVNECAQIDGVVLWALLVEQDDGSTRCSLRSRQDVRADSIARQFGGGGHARAAAATLAHKPPQARQLIVDAMTAVLADVADQPSRKG